MFSAPPKADKPGKQGAGTAYYNTQTGVYKRFTPEEEQAGIGRPWTPAKGHDPDMDEVNAGTDDTDDSGGGPSEAEQAAQILKQRGRIH